MQKKDVAYLSVICLLIGLLIGTAFVLMYPNVFTMRQMFRGGVETRTDAQSDARERVDGYLGVLKQDGVALSWKWEEHVKRDWSGNGSYTYDVVSVFVERKTWTDLGNDGRQSVLDGFYELERESDVSISFELLDVSTGELIIKSGGPTMLQ